MSRPIYDLDVDNLTDEEVQYFDERPWLKEEYERQTGNKFPVSEASAEDTSDVDEDDDLEDDDDDDDEDDDEDDEDLEDDEDEPVDYNSWDYDALVAELKSRNEDRGDDPIEPASRKSEDIAAALSADDEADEDE